MKSASQRDGGGADKRPAKHRAVLAEGSAALSDTRKLAALVSQRVAVLGERRAANDKNLTETPMYKSMHVIVFFPFGGVCMSAERRLCLTQEAPASTVLFLRVRGSHHVCLFC